MPVHISLSNVGTGASIIALVGSGSYTGNNVSVQTFTYDHTIGIATVVTSYARTVATELPDVIITGVVTSIFPGDTTVSGNFMLLILLILLHLKWELELVPTYNDGDVPGIMLDYWIYN